LYLARAAVTAAYGAAGSVVVVLLWLYFSAHMLLVGAEFTQVYSQRFGRGLSPAEAREQRRIDRERSDVLHA
jgi:membrane protein